MTTKERQEELDMFARAALTGLIVANTEGDYIPVASIVEEAYEYARAMLYEKEKYNTL